jgi:cobalt-zinc-cadmium efflux system protein
MGAGHHHHEGHAHGHARRSRDRRRLSITLVLVLAYMVAEVVGGLMTGSLALLADAGHMLSDAGALALSLFALWIAQRPSSPRRSYGYYRAEILAALANGAALVAIAIYIFVEAVQRIGSPPEVLGGPMILIALGGLLVNLVGLWLLSGADSDSLNIRGAWLHVLADALGSVGAVLAGACMLLFGWYWADPAASILIGLLVLFSSWELLQETVAVLMEGVPGNIDLEAVRRAIFELPGVAGVHDLHVWAITSGMVAMSGHVAVEPETTGSELLLRSHEMLRERFGIAHVTLQLEPADFADCRLALGCTDGGGGPH